jgi:NADH-ubiquinone oxidoreductase chain 2
MFSRLPFSFSFLLIILFGTIFSVSSSHWLGIWAGLEINLIGFLPLLVYQKSISERESAVKYFIIQAIGSRFLIFGRLNIYRLSFSWEVTSFIPPLSAGFIIIFMGLIIKSGIFPFYFWLPAVIAGLPWLSCLLLTTWQKVAPLFLVVSFINDTYIYRIILILCFFRVGSRLVGGIGGINQRQIRALIAYSSIGHLGWILFAAINRNWAIKAYFTIYILISICIFIGLWYSNLRIIKNLNIISSNTGSTVGVLIIFLSLGGLPPILGFISKWLVIRTRTKSIFWVMLLFLILGSVLSLFYYLSLLFSLFLSSFKRKWFMPKKIYKNHFVIFLGMFLNVVGGSLLLFNDFLLSW